MMDERKEEMAAMYALGMLEAQEARAFEEEMKGDSALRALVDDLTRDVAALAHMAPFQEAPADLREKILQTIHHLEVEEKLVAMQPVGPSPRVERQNVVPFKRPLAWLPWAMAAGFAVMSGLLFMDHVKMKRDYEALQSQTDFCQMKVSMLDPMPDNSHHGTAVVFWDPSTQTGVMTAENMPRPAANEDYQLWMVDSKYPQPVSAGVFNVDENGVARATFKAMPSTDSSKFAVSIEPKGGVQKHDKGPIIMMSK
ncbi:MAG: anti-sigma factor [Chthoniobacteraceae bacterium]